MTPSELTSRLDQVAVADVGSLNRAVRSDESVTIEQIDTLESADRDCNPIVHAERGEAKARFRKAFAQLSKQEREVAVMLYVEELTLREIGGRLGVTESRYLPDSHTAARAPVRTAFGRARTVQRAQLSAPRGAPHPRGRARVGLVSV